MGYRVTVRNEKGVKIAVAEAVGALDAMELIQLDGLPRNWFIVVETTEGTPFGQRLMELKPVHQ